MTLILFDPTAPRRAAPSDDAAKPSLESLRGAVVGFVDNAKPNFHVLVDELSELLKTKYGVARIVRHRKTSASIPAKPQVIEELVGECDVVIAGSGD